MVVTQKLHYITGKVETKCHTDSAIIVYLCACEPHLDVANSSIFQFEIADEMRFHETVSKRLSLGHTFVRANCGSTLTNRIESCEFNAVL